MCVRVIYVAKIFKGAQADFSIGDNVNPCPTNNILH